MLHSTPFVLKQAGWLDGYGVKTLTEIANLLVEYNVQECRVEEDFGQGMFAQLLRPYVKAAWDAKNKVLPQRAEDRRTNTEIVSERAVRQQKELRILEVLAPIFRANRLVMSKEVLTDDYKTTMGRDGTDLRDRYSLMYQITRLTREKDCLTHDDRVEGLSGVLAMFMEELGLMPAKQAEKAEEARMEEFEKQLFEAHDKMSLLGKVRRRLRGGMRGGGSRH